MNRLTGIDKLPVTIQHTEFISVHYYCVTSSIQGYYRSTVSDEDVARVQMLLELLFIRSGVYQLDNFSVSDVNNNNNNNNNNNKRFV